MSQLAFKGSPGHDQKVIKVSLRLYSWQDEVLFYVYSPALDISGYGISRHEARESFRITLQEFLNYTQNKQTLYDELERLGWTVNRMKKRVHAPGMSELLADNESFKEMYNRGNLREETSHVQLALA